MATDNKILWFGAGVVATILALRYYSKKKDVKVSDLKNENPPIIVDVPDLKPTPQQRSSALTANPLTLNAMGSGVKAPIYMSAQNLIPNIYDRGVGAPMYMNATGNIPSTDIQSACRCSVKKTPPKDVFSKFNLIQ
jgi:hypothetical protein